MDVDPVLRHFGSRKAVARKHFSVFVDIVEGSDRSGEIEAMLGRGSVGILGSDEFVDETIHRLGEHIPKGTPKRRPDLGTEALLAAVQEAYDVQPTEIGGGSKSPQIIEAKEALILCGPCRSERRRPCTPHRAQQLNRQRPPRLRHFKNEQRRRSSKTIGSTSQNL